MSYNEDFNNIMRPGKGDSKINLPITFDYNGGRKEYNKSRIIWVVVLAVIGLIVGIGIITSSGGFFITNLFLGVGFMFIVSLVIRFAVMREHVVRNDMLELLEEDYKMSTDDIWGIYAIDDMYPYYAHLRNGYTALFVRFEKDVILGREAENEFEHYEALGDAYNLVKSFNMGMCHIDYMGIIGDDDRIDNCFQSLIDVENPDMREILTEIYSNLQLMMDDMVTTFDVYVFTFRYSESTFWYHMKKILSCMLEANYVSFKILDSDELRGLAKSVFNLHDFSVVDACSSSFGSNRKAGVVPISIESFDGFFTKLNDTQEEKERKMRELEELKKSKKSKNNKVGKLKNKKDISDEVIDIFED